MNARLLIRAAGPGITVQDAGRFGHSRFGVTPAGPMDEAAFLAATGAVGGVAAIETSLGGAIFEAEGATLMVAVAGGAFDVRLDGERLPVAWCYVAVGARFDLPPALGSLATHARSGLGPKPLAAGDVLPLVDIDPPPSETRALHAPWLAPDDAPIRVIATQGGLAPANLLLPTR